MMMANTLSYSKKKAPNDENSDDSDDDRDGRNRLGISEQVMPISLIDTETPTNSKKMKNRSSASFSQVVPMTESKTSPKTKHARLNSRTSTERIKLLKNREEALARQVLWMALIAHMGKRTKLDVDKKRGCIFAPNGACRTYWDTVSMVFILYVMAFTPLQVAFMAPPLMETSISTAEKWATDGGCKQGMVPCFNYWGIFVMDLVIDLFFTADIVVNFRTSWVDNDPYSPMFKSVQYSCKVASWKYFKGMLLVDVMSVLPFWMVDLYPGVEGMGTVLRVPRLLRLAKLTKLLRVLRVSRVYSRWHKAITTTCSTELVMLIELTVVMMVSVHLMGCIWYLIADLQVGFDQDYMMKYGPDGVTTSTTTPNLTTTAEAAYESPPEWWEGNSWIHGMQDYQRGSLAEMYMASVYFALMTITTIGYGDIVPVIFTERLTAFMCMLIGIIVFAYVVGQVALLIRICTARRNRFFEDMTTLQAYLTSYPFGKAMRTRAIDYFYYTYNKKQYHFDNEARRATISHFSPFLGRSLAYAEMKHFLIGWNPSVSDLEHRAKESNAKASFSYPAPLPFLSSASQHIIKDLCAVLTAEVHGPIEIVAYQGGPCTKMFTLDHGCLCQWRTSYKMPSDPKLVAWKYVEKGARFGTDSLLLHLDPLKIRMETAYNSVWFQSVQTITFCDFICLSARKFKDILLRYPKQLRKMRPAILRAKLRMFFRSLPSLGREKILARMAKLGPAPEPKRLPVTPDLQSPSPSPAADKFPARKMTQQMAALREENWSLKDLVTDIQKQLSAQRSEFDEALKEQKQTMEEQRKAMEEQKQTMAQQHKELLALLKS